MELLLSTGEHIPLVNNRWLLAVDPESANPFFILDGGVKYWTAEIEIK
jgi:hypothetical protein